jgi:hypothetical protein
MVFGNTGYRGVRVDHSLQQELTFGLDTVECHPDGYRRKLRAGRADSQTIGFTRVTTIIPDTLVRD